MTCKLQFGDPKAIRLLQLGEKLKGAKPVPITDYGDTYSCPHCKARDTLDCSDEWGEDDDEMWIYFCRKCGLKSAERSLLDEFKQLKREFKQ